MRKDTMRNIRHLMLAVFAFAMLLGTSSDASARHSRHCRDSLQRCYQSCQELFEDQVLLAGCYGGCLIGYMYC